jgi:muramoyltetrapeptide carboxypeptidase
MQNPSFLKTGDNVAVVATAKRLQSGIEKGIDLIKSWGLNVIVGKHVFDESNLFAGSDLERLNDIQLALDDPKIKAIIMVRGGYGTTRILDQLDFTAFKSSPKWICGYSDMTALHQKLNNIGFSSIHSTMVNVMGKEDYANSDETLKNALFGKPLSYNFNHKCKNRIGETSGELCGGNLSIVCNSIGTSSEVSTSGKILFIEEVGEYLYNLDRMLVQLKRAGKFENLKGLVVGHFTNMKDHKDSFGLDEFEIIQAQCSDYEFPIAFGFHAGHEIPNYALYLGQEVLLSVKDNSALLEYKSGY